MPASGNVVLATFDERQHLYPSVNLRLSDDTDSGDTLRHTLTQEYADDAEPTLAFQAPRGRPSLVGRAPGGPA